LVTLPFTVLSVSPLASSYTVPDKLKVAKEKLSRYISPCDPAANVAGKLAFLNLTNILKVTEVIFVPFTITVIDTEFPVITCPSNIIVSNDAGQCGAIVTFTPPTATDNCPGVIVVTSHASGSFFPVGTTTVTSTATDAAGNTSTCTFTIRVNDTELPVITCPTDITVITPLGSCTATVSYSVTATDNCPAVITTLTGGLASGSAFPLGVNTVSWKATDAAGNTATCSFTVTVLDGQLPVISTQPVNITSCSGEKATFSVVATNVLTYQWQSFDGSTWNDIAGAISSTCTVNTVNTGINTQSYRVILTGLCSVVTSDHATLYVNPLPVIHLSASPFTALMPGRTTTLTATAIPAGGSYAWYKNETLIPGISSGSLTGLDVDAIGKYFVVYTDPNGCIDSSAYIELTGAPSAKLFVYPNPNQGRFQVRYYNGMNETVTLTVYDEKGSRIYTRKLVTTISYSSIEVNLGANFSSGTYIVELRDADNNQIAVKRVIVLQ
jgi:HYR domain/Secretion system C-terminal sorting domain